MLKSYLKTIITSAQIQTTTQRETGAIQLIEESDGNTVMRGAQELPHKNRTKGRTLVLIDQQSPQFTNDQDLNAE